jgi:hypothetical protein
MPSTFGIIVLGLALVAVVAGLVMWALQNSRRTSSASPRGSHPDAPVDENTAVPPEPARRRPQRPLLSARSWSPPQSSDAGRAASRALDSAEGTR